MMVRGDDDPRRIHARRSPTAHHHSKNMMSEVPLKICVVGPCKVGKTLLCRALAEQPILQGEYNPTAAVRCARSLLPRRYDVCLWMRRWLTRRCACSFAPRPPSSSARSQDSGVCAHRGRGQGQGAALGLLRKPAVPAILGHPLQGAPQGRTRPVVFCPCAAPLAPRAGGSAAASA